MLILAFTSVIFFTEEVRHFTPIVYLGYEAGFLGNARPIFSLGEWGRCVLLNLEMFGGVFLSLLVAILTISSLVPEVTHREVVWSTFQGGGLGSAWAKLMAVTTLTTAAIVVGACATFLNPKMRAIIVPAGWPLLPLYLGLIWGRVAIWVSICMLIFSIIRSRAASVFLVFAVQTAWFGTAGIWWSAPSFLQLIQRSLLSWCFLSVFTPRGVVPIAFFLQGLGMLGLILAFLGGHVLVKQKEPEGVNVRARAARIVCLLGISIAVGSLAGISLAINTKIAPFTATDLWAGKTELTRSYIWSSDLRFLVLPGEVTVLRLPLGAELPRWVTGLGDKVRRYERVGGIALGDPKSPPWERGIACISLVLVFGKVMNFPPPKLVGIWQQLQGQVEGLAKRARLWLEVPSQLTILWPADSFVYGCPDAESEGLILYSPEELLVP